MIAVTELRARRTFEIEGEPYLVLKYEHLKLGRGTANIKVKIRNLKTGAVTEKTYISGAKVEEITTIKKRLQYLYRDKDNFYREATSFAYFMDPKTFEQFSISAQVLGEQASFLTEGAMAEILFWSFAGAQDKEEPLTVELPPKMEFMVAETGPGVKGDSATNIFKPATLSNGLKIKVPLFVNQGDKILVDTRTGEYMERVK